MPSPLELITAARRAQAAETPAAPLERLSNQQWRVRGTPIGETEAAFFKQREAQQAIRDRELKEALSPTGLAGMGLGAATGFGSQIVGAPGDIRSIYEEFKPESFPNAPQFLKSFPTTEEIQEELGSKTGTPEYKTGMDIGNAIAIAQGIKAIPSMVKSGAQAAGAVGKMVGKEINEAMLTGQGPLAHALAPVVPRRLDVYHGGSRFAPTPENPLGAFDPNRIGTGEGLQYGHGIYLSEAPDVSRGYVLRDMDYEEKLFKLYQQAEKRNDPFSMEILERAMMHKTPSELRLMYPPQAAGLISQIEKIPHAGALYKANLPDKLIPRMLDLDKPFMEQPHVLKALEAEGVTKETLDQVAKNIGTSGDALYQYMARRLGGQKQASDYMRRIGIPGNVYLDPSQKDLGLNVRNFVVFPGEEKAVRIKQRMKSGGEVGMDAMRMAVWGKPDHKQFGGVTKSGKVIPKGAKAIEDALELKRMAGKSASDLYPEALIANKVIKPDPIKASKAFNEILGEKVSLTPAADRMVALPGVSKQKGGPFFPWLSTVDPRYEGWVWGNKGPSNTTKMINLSKDYPGLIFTPQIGAADMHRSNQVTYEKILRAFERAQKEGKLTPELQQAYNDRLKSFYIDEESGKPLFKEDFDIATTNLRKEANTFPQRAAISEVLGGVGLRDYGFKRRANAQIIPYDTILRMTTEPLLADIPTGSVGPRFFQLSGERAVRPDLHSAFPEVTAGKDLNIHYAPTPRDLVFTDFIKQIEDTKGRKPGHMDWDRNKIVQEITPETIYRLQDAGKKRGGKVAKKADGGMTSDDLIVEERKL